MILSLLFFVYANPSPLPQAVAAELAHQALAKNQAYEFLESLTTEVGQRKPDTAGDARATAWALARLKSMGFDKVWSQEVPFPIWARDEESGSIVAPYFHPLALSALGNSGPTPEAGIEAEVLAVPDYQALLKLTAEQCAGKILYISQRMAKDKHGNGYGECIDGRSMGPAFATRNGAAALILRSLGTDNNRLPHTGSARMDDLEKLLPAAAISTPDAELLDQMLKRGKPVRIKLKLNCGLKGAGLSHNVIAELKGREKPDEIVLLGAHIDSWDYGTGALDDGAGMAIIAEAARLIGGLPQRPKRTIRVVFFACEESGLHGATAYAKAYGALKHVVGGESDTGADRCFELGTKMDPKLRGALEPLWQTLEPLGITRGDNDSGHGSDLRPLRELGMPVFSLLQDCSRYFDYHHTANDTLDKVDPAALSQNVAAWAALAYLSAELELDFGKLEPAKR